MLAFLLSPIYILINFYIIRWLIWWMGVCNKHFNDKYIRNTIIIIYIFFATSLLTGFLLPNNIFGRIIKLIGNYYLGVFEYVILIVFIADIIRHVLRHFKKLPVKKIDKKRLFVKSGTICVSLILILSIYGVINARVIRTTKYVVDIDKSVSNMNFVNIVMVADLHMGYNIGTFQVRNMVNAINKENPDLVVIAGDIFDNDYDSLDDPDELKRLFKSIESKYGVYAIYGNHDIEEKVLAGFTFDGKDKVVESDLRMDEFLKESGITLLRDDYVIINDSFYLYGRPDYQKLGRGITERKTAYEITSSMDKTMPIIVLDHQPREMEELSKAGVDLDLSGHTHDGQLFPGNLLLKFVWDNSYGLKKYNNMTQIVTSGVGVFGPNMRVGTKAEITSIKVNFNLN